MTPRELAAVEHRLAQFIPALEGLVARLASASRLDGNGLATTGQHAAAAVHAGLVEFADAWERLGFESSWAREPMLNSRVAGFGMLIGAFEPLAKRAGYLPQVEGTDQNFRIRFSPDRDALEKVLGPNRKGEGTITPVVVEDAELRALEESLRLIRIRPPRQMTLGGDALHFDFDADALVKLSSRIQDAITGLEHAMRRAADHGWAFEGGNAIEMPKYLGPFLDLAEVTGIQQRPDLLWKPKYGIEFGAKAERFRGERGLAPARLLVVFADLTSWIMGVMRELYDERAEHDFPEITEGRLQKLRSVHEDLAALLGLESRKGIRADDAPSSVEGRRSPLEDINAGTKATLAMLKLLKRGERVSIRRVCELARVDRKNLMRRHPAVVRKIKELSNGDQPTPKRGAFDRRSGTSHGVCDDERGDD